MTDPAAREWALALWPLALLLLFALLFALLDRHARR